jgi:hypothetical protein
MSRFDPFPIIVGLFIVGCVVVVFLGIVHNEQARANCERQHGVYLTWKGGAACVVDGQFRYMP